MIKDPKAACIAYAKENADAEGTVMTCTLDGDLDGSFKWAHTWEDGVPVTKMFERCERAAPVHIPDGTVLMGVQYRGRASGHEIFEFIWGQTWYRAFVGCGFLFDTDLIEVEE